MQGGRQGARQALLLSEMAGVSGCEEAKQILRKEIQDVMNRRQWKKAMKKKGAEAIVNQNEHLKRENGKLKREVSEARDGLEEVYASCYALIGAITRCYGEVIEGRSVIEFPIDEARTVLDNYDIKFTVEDGKYIICAMPKVDPEAE